MKNFLATLTLLLLTGCTTPTEKVLSCDTSSDYAESTQQEWKTSTFTLTYNQPFCWSVETSNDSKLLLKDGDSDHFVEMSTTPITPEQVAPFVSTHTLPDGTVLTLYTNSADDHEIQIILSSL